MTKEELIYDLTKDCADILSNLDKLEGFSIYKYKMKKAAKELAKECNKQVDEQFNDNKALADLYDRELALPYKLQSLSTAERLAVDEFINEMRQK